MSSLDQLNLVSYLAPNMFWFYKAVAADLGRVLGVKTQIVQSEFELLADPAMLQDQVDLAFICGLPLVLFNQVRPNQLQPIVAPVMQARRYQNRPVYFSDIIVNAKSNFITFEDLAGKIVCYNEPGSNSGYNLIRQRLMQANYPSRFFGQVIESGSHQHSIKLVVEQIADCSAIDSTVLEQELRDSPELSNHLRVIESIGPCTMPPIIAAQRLGSALIELIQSTLCQPNLELQSAMQQAQIQSYARVTYEDYAAIATMYDLALNAGYEQLG